VTVADQSPVRTDQTADIGITGDIYGGAAGGDDLIVQADQAADIRAARNRARGNIHIVDDSVVFAGQRPDIRAAVTETPANVRSFTCAPLSILLNNPTSLRLELTDSPLIVFPAPYRVPENEEYTPVTVIVEDALLTCLMAV